MENTEKWHTEKLAERTVQALKKNGFHSIYVESKEEAMNFILYHVNTGTSVGIGGSVTIKSLNIHHNIIEKGAIILDHSEGSTEEEQLEIMRKELTSDVYLCSTNAVTLDGHLINVDGAGNRVAAMTFGPKKIIIIAGVNKIVKDDDTAFERLKFIASPQNNKRLKLNNPCVNSGTCMDCKSEKRICRIYSVVKMKPMRSDISVIIVGDNLGF
jgi:L-lactate utilization protein LutB